MERNPRRRWLLGITAAYLVIVTSGCVPTAEAETMSEHQYGWAQGGPLVTGSGGTALTGRGGAVNMKAELAREDGVTIQFNVSLPSRNVRPHTQATIVSTIAGNEVKRRITVVDGSSITVRGKTIQVQARDYTLPSIDIDHEYNVEILATLGIRASINQPPVLEPLIYATSFANFVAGTFIPVTGTIVVAPGAVAVVPIPEDSGVNSVLVTAGRNNAAGVFDQDDVSCYQVDIAAVIQRVYNPMIYTEFVPIVSNSSGIALLVKAGAPDSVEFAVSFGVDG